jgi:vacuolar-type H+-ATPase subunit I/STV1
MRKLFNVLVLTLAVNFVVVAGFVAWLRHDGRIDRARIAAIKEILFPPPPPEVPTSQPVTDQLAQPTLKLEELLAKTAGRPAAEQLEYIQKSFDSQMAQLDRAHRELTDLNQQVEQARSKLNDERKALDDKEKKLGDRERQAQRLASDQGFQNSLSLYETLPAKQVKTIFMGLEDATVIQYLQAMEGRTAAKITKEFKSPEESERLKRLLERMRQPQAAAK